VRGSPKAESPKEYPLNLQGASSPTLARWPPSTGGGGRRTGPPLKSFTSPLGARQGPRSRATGPRQSRYRLPYSRSDLARASFCAWNLIPLDDRKVCETTGRGHRRVVGKTAKPTLSHETSDVSRKPIIAGRGANCFGWCGWSLKSERRKHSRHAVYYFSAPREGAALATCTE